MKPVTPSFKNLRDSDCHSSVYEDFWNMSFFSMAQLPLRGQYIVEASRPHLETPHSLGLLWAIDRPIADTSIQQHTTLTAVTHPCSRRDTNSHSQQTKGRTPTPLTVRPLGSANVIPYLLAYSCVHIHRPRNPRILRPARCRVHSSEMFVNVDDLICVMSLNIYQTL